MASSWMVVIVIFLDSVLGEKFIVNLKISENTGGDSDIINLKAYVLKNKLNINCSGPFDIISTDLEVGNYFVLYSNSGLLKLRSNIDREAICKHSGECQMTMLISVNGKILEVVISIGDVNDNSPQFSLRYKTLVIQENNNIGIEISLPTAEDADSPEYGIARYYLEDSRTSTTGRTSRYRATNYFRIVEKMINNVKIPYLKTIKDIDREEIDQFEFILVAEDSGKQTGSCTITVNVADVNDNSPQWPSSSIHKKVRECDRQGPLLELQAFDRDDSSTANGQIKYKISDHSPKIELINRMFYISGSNLFLSSHSLQIPEIGNKIGFFITAMDGGARENDTAVTIEIEDCNDHAPIITLAKRSATVTENDKSLKLLTTLTVRDDDRDSNSEFTCELNDTAFLTLTNKDLFPQQNGGRLVLYELEKIADVAFDREKSAFYSVIIRCIDQGQPALIGEKIFNIAILDENDNAPKFPNKEIRFSASENNLIGTVIGHVKAVDLDSIENGRISYQIINNEDNFYFSITNYGKIEAKWKFDREVKSSYSFTVMARDNGVPPLNDTCHVRITILDVNDCLPTFKQQYFYQVVESNGATTIHSILGKIVAEDPDLAENGTVYFEIMQTNPIYKKYNVNSRPLLKIGADGTLSIFGVVDREKMPSIQAEVIAFDNGRPQLSSVTTIIVDVLDLNDNKPRFKYPTMKSHSINVSSETAVGTNLVSIEAEDPDKGENGTISYSIIGRKSVQENSPFQLQQDGRLILIQSIKERDSTGRLPDQFLIQASDGGNPALVELLTLNIKYVMSDPRSKDSSWPSSTRKKADTNQPNSRVVEGAEGADNMMLLYILAGILFTVFIIVLVVLMYTYFSGRFIRGRHFYNSHEKQLNNFGNDGPGNHECELLTSASLTNARDDFHKVSTISMAFPTVEKGNYTHLMLNESKYTPIQITPNYFQTISHQNPPPFTNESYGTTVKHSGRHPSKWNSIENLIQTNDTKLGTIPNNQDHSFLYNAHSYAAYINQFGKDDIESKIWTENRSNNVKLRQKTLPSSWCKDDQNVPAHQLPDSQRTQSKKCYVTSSFV